MDSPVMLLLLAAVGSSLLLTGKCLKTELFSDLSGDLIELKVCWWVG